MKFSLENKINLGFGVALLILIAIGLFSYWTSIDQAIIIVGGGSLVAVVFLLIAISDIKFDLMQRKHFEAELQEREALFRATFEKAPIGIGLTDMQGSMLASNLAFQQLLGYSAEELRQMTITQITYSGDIEETKRLFQELVDGERPSYQVEKRYVRQDGRVIWGRTTAALVRDSQGCPLFAIGMIEDITERNRVKAELHKLSLAVEQSASIVIITDPQGYIEYANPRFTETTGYTVAEAIGQHTRILKSGKTSPAEYQRLWETITTGKVWRGEFHNKKKNGELYWESASISPIRNAEGVITNFLAVKEDITGRKQAEEALRQSEATQRAVLDAIPDFMFQTNQNGDYIPLRNFGEATLSRAHEPAKRLTDVLPPHIAQQVLDQVEQIYQTGAQSFEYSLGLPGETKYYEARLVSSGLDETLCILRDITERKRAEEALSQSEAKYRLVVDNVKEVIFQVDASGYFTFLNSAWTEITGFSVEESLGSHFLTYNPPEYGERFTEFFQALLKQEIEYIRHEFRLLDKDGHLVWVEIYAQLIQAADGTILGASGSLNDITDRKRAERALRASETRFRTLAMYAPVGIFESNAQGELVFVNQRWCDLAGMTLTEALGQGWTKALHPDDRERVLAEGRSIRQSGGEFALEHRYQTPAGKVTWVFGNALPLRNEAGEITGYLGTMTDITASKQVAEILAQRATQLMLINNISSKIAAVLDLDSVLDQAATLVQSTFGYHHVALFLLDNDVAGLKAIAGSYTKYFPANHTQELDRGIIGWVATHGEKVVANDVSQESRYISKIADQTVTQAELCLPIKVAGQTVGVLDLQSPHLDAFGENDILLMETLVAQIAVAIENARLYQAAQLELAERQRAEESLAQERNLLRTLIDNMPDSIYVKDTAGRHLLVNNASMESKGSATMAEILGKTDLDLYPSEVAQQWHADDMAVIQSGQPLINQEEPRVDATGAYIGWDLATKVPLYDGQGQVLGLLGVTRDITERKQMEETLRQSEERFALAVQGSKDGIWDIDFVNNNTLYWSPRLKELHGYIPDELEPSQADFDSSLHPDDKERVFAAIETHLKDHVPFNIEHRIRTKSGEYRWHQTRGQAIWDETGRPVRMVGSVTDITERKQMELVLAEERNLLQTVINASPDWIFIKDQNHRFRLINQSYADALNLSTDTFLGKDELELGFPEEIVKGNPEQGILGFWPSDRKVLDTGESSFIPDVQAVVNGQTIIQNTVKVPVRDSAGKVSGVLGFAHDITELKRIQHELEQAKDAAEAATRVKSEFLANMSHEIRTPLNAVVGMTSLLLDTPLSSEQQDFAETIRTSGDTLLATINDILDFSKIEAGKLELEKQPFDLRQCIEESLDLVAIKAAEKKLELAYLIDDETPSTLVGDVTRLRQILVNLLNNAVKFTGEGEVVLSVRSHLLERKPAGPPQRQNGHGPVSAYEVHFSVRDTGIGIPADRMDRLFRSFSQVDASTTRKYGGTGLGLTISQRLSEIMGGRMWVESDGIPGEGSTFHFTLLAEPAPSQPRVYLRSKQPELAGKHLLIVDDNATNRLILARQAQAWGMRPRAAVSGEEALVWIRRGDPFDLAILDMQMPDMDGLTLAAEIRQHRPAQTLPLIMLTSLGQREDNDQFAQIKFASFLTKPIKPSHLYNIIQGVFEGQPIKIKPDSTPSSVLDAQLGQRHPLRILLAEDNAVNQKVALHLLGRIGYLADVAANGLEVLQALERQPYDVVLMDMQMPEMDGLEATRAIHEQWPDGQCPWIIAMTANALQGDRERCLEAGMNDYISKPVRPEDLTRALNQSPTRSEPLEVKAFASPINPAEPDGDKGNSKPSQHGQVLETKVLAELRELLGERAPQMIAELIDLYLDTAMPLLEEIRSAIPRRDGQALFRAAHTLKSSSAHLGAVHLAAMCAELETLGQTGQLEGAVAQQMQLEAEFSRVSVALEIEKRDVTSHVPLLFAQI